MTHRMIAIPGETTRFEDCPQITFRGGGNTSVSVTITYHAAAAPPGVRPVFGELTFSDVLEFRWIENDVLYEEYPQHEEDYEFGLVEILDSAYIETMAARGRGRDHAGIRIRGQPESLVRHFRMGFDGWGELNIIATDISVRTLDANADHH